MGSETTGSTMQVHYYRREPLSEVHSLESALKVAATRPLTREEQTLALAEYQGLLLELTQRGAR
ncbi:hypothetical protein DRW03_21170 [Corallococcus sp. H22C18031201]|nr:hypothetical protein DRW03_21170 [Corallococcus sp. H22C18031201]